MRKTSDAGAQLVARFEGCRLTAYKCPAGVWTIGYGHTDYIKFFNKNVCSGMTITHDQAVELLKDDLVKFEASVNKYYSKYTWNQNEFDALVSFALNNGSIEGLTAGGTRSRSVISAKFLEYNKAKVNGVLTPLAGLTTRRIAERILFLTGSIDTEVKLSTLGLTDAQIKANIINVQKWLNRDYDKYIKKCGPCYYRLLTEDGKMGNKTRAALTIVLQVFLNAIGAELKIDGDYGTSTNNAVKKLLVVKKGTENISAKVVQAILQCYGYNPQLFYPSFNDNCVEALKLCQADHNLNNDGVAGVIFFTTFLRQR